MKILDKVIQKKELLNMSEFCFGDEMVKAVVDLGAKKIAIDAELHADLEALLLDNGAIQANLWGINFYPDEAGDDFIEFDSIINIRPKQNNLGRDVYDPKTKSAIIEVINQWIK